MSKPYDSTMKQLLDLYAADWLSWLSPEVGLPAGIAAEPIDSDLSTITAQVDKVFRLQSPAWGLVHLEPQASFESALADRLLLYNVLLHHRHELPVTSVVLLLRREAYAPSLTGSLERADGNGRVYHRFQYHVIRIWEQPLDRLLAGGLGTIPLALLTDEASADVPRVIEKIQERFQDEHVQASVSGLMWSASFLLLGLRYDNETISRWFQGVYGMEESTTYQMILNRGLERGLERGIERGIQRGAIATRQEDILALLAQRFGNISRDLVEQIRSVTDLDRLRDALIQAGTINSLDDFKV